MSSPITLRRPTASAFSEGTLTVMSLCRILMVRYSRFSPSTSRLSFFTTVPAPWCGYTTLSPTLYKPEPPLLRLDSPQHDRSHAAGGAVNYSENRLKPPLFQGFPASTEKPCSERTTASGSGPRDCALGAA